MRHLVGHVSRDEDAEKLLEAAARSDAVSYWIDKIEEGLERGTIHGSFDHCIENGLSRLLQWRMSSESIRRIDARLSAAEVASRRLAAQFGPDRFAREAAGLVRDFQG